MNELIIHDVGVIVEDEKFLFLLLVQQFEILDYTEALRWNYLKGVYLSGRGHVDTRPNRHKTQAVFDTRPKIPTEDRKTQTFLLHF